MIKLKNEFKRPIEKSRPEICINLIICIFIIFLTLKTIKVLNEKWIYLEHLPIFIYFGTLFFYLLMEKYAYKGPGINGKQLKKYTRYLLLLFWWTLLPTPLLEYSFYQRYCLEITFGSILLTILGTSLRAWAIVTLGKYFSVHIQVEDEHRLIDTGPYKFIRHPAYAGNILQAVGIPLILNAYFSLGISAILVFLFLHRLKLEERILTREIKGYADYMTRTKKLIPKIL